VTQHYENKAFQKNAQVQAAQVSIDEAVAEVNRLSPYARSAAVTEAQAKFSELQTQIEALWAAPAVNSRGHRTGESVYSQLDGACPGTSWYHRKYCPKIQALESQMRENQTVVDNNAAYLAAVEHKNSMIKGMAELEIVGINPDSYMHPLFIGMGALMGSSPKLVKYRLLLVTSAMIELLGSLFFVVGLLLKGQTYSVTEIAAMEKQKEQMLAALGVKVIDIGKTEYTQIGVSDPKTSLHTR
jgi:hypothetical protein